MRRRYLLPPVLGAAGREPVHPALRHDREHNVDEDADAEAAAEDVEHQQRARDPQSGSLGRWQSNSVPVSFEVASVTASYAGGYRVARLCDTKLSLYFEPSSGMTAKYVRKLPQPDHLHQLVTCRHTAAAHES